MTPKEKANEIVRKYYAFGLNNIPFQSYSWFECKKLALIAVDEILEDDMYDMGEGFFNARIQYWQEVKQEIEKL